MAFLGLWLSHLNQWCGFCLGAIFSLAALSVCYLCAPSVAVISAQLYTRKLAPRSLCPYNLGYGNCLSQGLSLITLTDAESNTPLSCVLGVGSKRRAVRQPAGLHTNTLGLGILRKARTTRAWILTADSWNTMSLLA